MNLNRVQGFRNVTFLTLKVVEHIYHHTGQILRQLQYFDANQYNTYVFTNPENSP